MKLTGGVVALALAFSSVASAAEPLAPTGKWTVSFEDDLCAMSHEFGTAPGTVTLALRPFPLNDQMEAVLILPKSNREQRKGKGTVTFGSGRVVDATFDAFDTRQKVRVIHLDLARAVINDLADAGTVSIAADGKSYALAMPSAVGALKVLDQCETSLLKEWGVDPALRDKEQAALTGNPGQYFGPDDYPSDALRAEASGRVVALLSVTAEGRVGTCRVVRSSRVAALDERTCSIARRSIRYKPAIGEKGQPVASYALLPVRWEAPTN